MKYTVTVKTQAKESKVLVKKDKQLHVFVTAQAKDGEANGELIKILAQHFGVPKWKVHIISGNKSPNKIIEVI